MSSVKNRADDRSEIEAWEESLEALVRERGREVGRELLERLAKVGRRLSVEIPWLTSTPYLNTIPKEHQPPYPGDLDMERRIRSLIRWNAMAMVVKGNKA